MSQAAIPRPDSTHHRLHEFARNALINIFVHPYATVCELYCGGGLEAERWEEAQIGHYIGIDVTSSGISEKREAWESLRKAYTTDFYELDPCTEDLEAHLQEKTNQADLVCCLQHLQLCFESEDKARKLLHNVSSLLKPGGYFFGITPDSSTIWAKYQKNVEAYHNRSGSMKPGIVPNCVRSESYMITFEVEEEKFPSFGKRYQLKLAGDIPAETHCLVHFPSLIRLAREAGLEYVEIQNLTEFYDDNKAIFAGMLMGYGASVVDPRGRLLPRSYDMLDTVDQVLHIFGTDHAYIPLPLELCEDTQGLYTTFIFQKPDPDAAPPLTTPLLMDGNHHEEEREWTDWREEETIVPPEPPAGLGKITEQKGILGPGPAELRFAEAL